jgi:signal transduction histidine kinase
VDLLADGDHLGLEGTDGVEVAVRLGLEARGVSRGIAHELNNPINFVTSSAHSLRRDIDDLNTVVNGALALDPADGALPDQVAALHHTAEDLDLAYTQREVEELLTGI